MELGSAGNQDATAPMITRPGTVQGGDDECGTPPFAIRGYRDDDWPAVCVVHDRARPDELSASCDPRAFVPLAKERSDAESFHRSRKFVACLGEKVVGFVGVDDVGIAVVELPNHN
jgi:hypothetical protein